MGQSAAPTESPLGLRTPILHARPRSLLALLGWLVLATVISLTAWALKPLLVDKASDEIVQVRSIQFRMVPNDRQAGTDWQPVTLVQRGSR